MNQVKEFGEQSAIYEQGFFFAKSGKSFHKISLAEVMYFESEREYVKVVTASKSLLVYNRLKMIENALEMPFIRVHNSYIINVCHIIKIQDNHVHINDQQIPITMKFKTKFMSFVYGSAF